MEPVPSSLRARSFCPSCSLPPTLCRSPPRRSRMRGGSALGALIEAASSGESAGDIRRLARSPQEQSGSMEHYFLTVVVMKFLGWLLAAPRLDTVTAETFGELQHKYRSRDRWGNVICLVAFIGAAVIYDYLLYGLTALLAWRFGDATYLLPPDNSLYRGAGVGLSFVSSTYFVFVALRRYLGREEYNVYMAYGGLRLQGIHTGKLCMWIFLLCFPPLWFVSVQQAAAFTALTQDALHDASFGAFGIPNEHLYKDVRDIYFAKRCHARNGDVESPQYVIVFNDGYRRKTQNGRENRAMEKQVDMVRYVVRQSCRPTTDVKFAEDIPP